jgi:hypothetical protein
MICWSVVKVPIRSTVLQQERLILLIEDVAAREAAVLLTCTTGVGADLLEVQVARQVAGAAIVVLAGAAGRAGRDVAAAPAASGRSR